MIAKNLAFVLLAFLFHGCDKQKMDDPDLKMASIRGYQNWYIGKFRCGVFVPPSYDPSRKYPLVVILHGHTDTTSWNRIWYNEPFVTNDPCIVLTPKCPVEEEEGWGNSWSNEISPMMQKTFEMMDLAKRAFNLDTTRYYIHGTSMGAIGIYGVLQKRPGLFTAAYLECGAGNDQIAPLLLKTPLWVFHGSNDYVVYASYDRNMYAAVLERGGKLMRYTEYPGVAHNVWDYTRNEPTLPYWLLAQRKGEVHGAPDSTSVFSADVISGNYVKLGWQPPADQLKKDNHVWYYKIYRNGNLLKELDNTHLSFTDSSAQSNTLLAYQISAVNFFFQESQRAKAHFIKIED